MRWCWPAATSPGAACSAQSTTRLHGALLEADVGLTQRLTKGCHTGSVQLLRGGKVAEQMPGDGALPEFVEAGGEARQGCFEVLANLAVEGGALADQVAAVADDELQGGPGLVAGRLEQRTACDGGAVDGVQIGVVGLVARIDGLAILLGDEGVQNARLEASTGEAALDDAVIAAGTLDGDETVAELVRGKGVSNLSDGGVQVRSVMGDVGRRDKDASIEVGEEELGAHLGTVEADDAEVLGTDLLDARVQHAGRLANMLHGTALRL